MLWQYIFQLTASRGGWRRSQWLSVTEHTFQLTASRGGWLSALTTFLDLRAFQLTASRGGWLRWHLRAYLVVFISTHSLTRRLTWGLMFVDGNFLISTHSLTRRLTSISATRSSRLVFQLTASRGGWRCRPCPRILQIRISTHSLTRRLTMVLCFQ